MSDWLKSHPWKAYKMGTLRFPDTLCPNVEKLFYKYLTMHITKFHQGILIILNDQFYTCKNVILTRHLNDYNKASNSPCNTVKRSVDM